MGIPAVIALILLGLIFLPIIIRFGYILLVLAIFMVLLPFAVLADAILYMAKKL